MGLRFTCCWCSTQKLLRLDIQHQFEKPGCEFALSPVAHMCWTDEDMIGRISRLSRRCHALTTARRCIDRALCNYRRQFGIHFSRSYLQKREPWCDKPKPQTNIIIVFRKSWRLKRGIALFLVSLHMLGALATVSTSVSRSRMVWRRGWGMARRDGLV